MKKILLLGDSIRQGYDKYVKMAFEGVAEVYYPSENCRFTSYMLRYLSAWKDELQCGNDIDLVHWNAGLWDDLVLPDGLHHIPLDTYQENVERICKMLQSLFPKAKIVFATSTAVQEELFGKFQVKRYNKDTEKYNEAAARIVKQCGGEINDLYALSKNAPSSYQSDQTHYYTMQGTKLFTDQVIDCIEKNLGIKAQKPNYEALFRDEKEICGIRQNHLSDF